LFLEYHKSVLVDAVVRSLKAPEAKLIWDVTVGDGGYPLALFNSMTAASRVVGSDRDPEALTRAKERLSFYHDRFLPVVGNFRDIGSLAAVMGISEVDGIVGDFGVSQKMLSAPASGFSYAGAGPLTMQMGPDCPLDASQIVNDYSEQEIARMIKVYGEEKKYRAIARAIVRYRRKKRIETTDELADIVRSVVPGRFSVKSLARVFQSIRIVVNDELENIKLFLPQAVRLLRPGGRLVLLSYNSLEDRLVKHFFREMAHPCICPPEIPRCVCGKKPVLEIIGKLVTPGEDEVKSNPQCRSAKMRVAQKI
jgi:16S rRNA (cytosine1402-N4)-methyltransferase